MRTQHYFSILIIVVTLGGCSLLGGSDDDSERSVHFETLIKEPDDRTPSLTIEAEGPVRFVVRSEAEEDLFSAQYLPDVPFPSVDYSEHAVVGVVAGRRPNNSYEIAIDSIYISGPKLTVQVTEIGSAGGGRVITYPNHIVTVARAEVSRRDLNVVIERKCLQAPCSWD